MVKTKTEYIMTADENLCFELNYAPNRFDNLELNELQRGFYPLCQRDIIQGG